MTRFLLVSSGFLLLTFLTRFAASELSEAGGNYDAAYTLSFRNSPFKVSKQIVVGRTANLTIEQGVTLEFSPGVGITVLGTLHAIGAPRVRIRLKPRVEPPPLNSTLPRLRLVDGPSVQQGRLQVYERDRWRSVCTMLTNWTRTDYSTACRGMGYSGGGFWRWFRRNNDTRPFVLPRPGCNGDEPSLFECPAMLEEVQMSENLCQGEDDLGLICFGPPTFPGASQHWLGIEFIDSPFYSYPDDDFSEQPIAFKRRSKSHLEWIDVEFAGYDGRKKNTTAAVSVKGVPPVMNFLEVRQSAGNGLQFWEPAGPVEITNSTIENNRGHGISIQNTTDGRVFINQTRVIGNWGDGVSYSVKHDTFFYPARNTLSPVSSSGIHVERPLYDMCATADPPTQEFYPQLIEASLRNGTLVDGSLGVFPCSTTLPIPGGLPYTYTIQFLHMHNRNPAHFNTTTQLLFCDTGPACDNPQFTIPVIDRVVPSSIVVQNRGSNLWIGLRHEGAPRKKLAGDIRVVLRVFALVKDQVLYGMNISNSRVTDNLGRGLFLHQIRDRVVVNNVTLLRNQYLAGIQIWQGAGDVWINNTQCSENLGDGLNISYAGGSILVNGTRLEANQLRGMAVHYNRTEAPFMPLAQSVILRGQRSNSDETETIIRGNLWGGVVIGNFCSNAFYEVPYPKIAVNFVQFEDNAYHPSFEYFSCQNTLAPQTNLEFTSSRCTGATGFCFKLYPAVNLEARISQNNFFHNKRSPLLIRNREFPQLSHLPATVQLIRNEFKFNRGPFIVSIGLNEGAKNQWAEVKGQNEIKNNEVYNPYPLLNPRNNPYAAMIVSSSNVNITGNCFTNDDAKYEIATDLAEHAKTIPATSNSWGSQAPEAFMPKIFDATKRYNLARIDVDPYASLCNQNYLRNTPFRNYIPPYSDPRDPSHLGGMIYESIDLPAARYRVSDDLHILPGAKLTLEPGVELEFENGIGMLVQGELLRMGTPSRRNLLFTYRPVDRSTSSNIRLVNDKGLSSGVSEGRLEILDQESRMWGAVCNRSWTPDLAAKACHQLGLIADLEFLENWWTYPKPGATPILWDNIWCEEMEPQIADCRHDGPLQNVNVTCPKDNVVGLRCIEPKWAGIRYTLLANPPSTTNQEYIHHVVIEKAGLMDYYTPIFSPALQIDWNYHTFKDLIVRDNFWTGIDIVYNDLVKKPKIENCILTRNRRHGLRSRTYGLTLMHCNISDNQNAGIRYNPIVSHDQQRDVVTWLERRDISRNQIVPIPDPGLKEIKLAGSTNDGRKFLTAVENPDFCIPGSRCRYELTVLADSSTARVGISVINRPEGDGDENVFIEDGNGHTLDLRKDLIRFPHVSDGNRVKIVYTRSRGVANVKLLIFYQNVYDYLTPFIHIANSEISANQYAISTLHYSDFEHDDGSILIRYEAEQLWFQKVDFLKNKQAVIWVNGPLRDAKIGSPIAEIEYFIDNCSIALNNGSIIETHRDLYQSANVFHWRVWRTNFIGNFESGIDIRLPDTYDAFSKKIHNFVFTENLIHDNQNFKVEVGGFYAWMNISMNNFTYNTARKSDGLFKISGMEKEMIFERNRFEANRGNFIYLHSTQSQSPNFSAIAQPRVLARIHRNLFAENFFLNSKTDRLVDHYPRSFTLGILGVQKVDVNYNDISNDLIDFEAVVGLQGVYFEDKVDLRYNYWGRSQSSEVAQRIFDFDDWNVYSLAEFSPFFMNAERPWRWEWQPSRAQTDTFKQGEPPISDLHGMVSKSIRLERRRQKWPTWPASMYYKPDVPYIITKDVTIMPGVTLTIDPGVEIHIGPGVRILVLGTLEALGTPEEPIRLRPINVTEMARSGGRLFDPTLKNLTEYIPINNRMKRDNDQIYRKFPLLHRQDTFFQKFDSFLVGGDPGDKRSGFLEIYNSTTGQMVPICDRQFTRRNAEVVCRELGMETYGNAYSFVGPRYDYNPRILITRFYSEPRQCYGDEYRLSDCNLRIIGNRDLWYCSDTEHFVFIHCGRPDYINSKYIGAWGGITVANWRLEEDGNQKPKTKLQFVEIVGAGRSHNSTDGAALEIMFQNVDLQFVNVTNSSMHGVNVIGAPGSLNFQKLNVTFNRGRGVSVFSMNALSDRTASYPLTNLTIPYNLYGAVGLCSARKVIEVKHRVLVYFKYDNFPVDCYKVFRSTVGRNLGVRFFYLNLYDFYDDIGRIDSIRFYKSDQMSEKSIFHELNHTSPYEGQTITAKGDVQMLTMYLRANPAGPEHGFLAEVFTLPAAPDSAYQERVNIVASRFEYNDRGALSYASIGERNPIVGLDRCYFGHNGYHLWGNFTTSQAAVDLTLQNTLMLRLTNSMFWKNIGGLKLGAGSTTSIARLAGLIKNVAFSQNSHYEVLRLTGHDFQEVSILNSYFGKNHVPYRDVVFVDKLISNFSHNIFYNNTGTHIVDISGYQVKTDLQGFYHNFVYDNVAFGHGYRYYNASYGYIPPNLDFREIRRRKRSKNFQTRFRRATSFRNRFKRATSFDWWTHVGANTDRYKSTILAGSNQQRYAYNYVVNPANDFELTTVKKDELGQPEPLNARDNWWGPPGTESVATGRIRDFDDDPQLIRADYSPVLSTNATLLDNGCPPGWFYAGQDRPTRIKSCFLFVGGALPYHDASQFCMENDGFLPFFQDSDPRLSQISKKLAEISSRTHSAPRLIPSMLEDEEPLIIWISGVMVPPQQCGYLTPATAAIGYFNCEAMLPFVCEKGPNVHAHFFWLSKSGIFAIVISILLFLLILLILLCWFIKSRRRKREFFERKNSLRDSLRSNRSLKELKTTPAMMYPYGNQFTPVKENPMPQSPDIISSTHARLAHGASADSLAMHKGSELSRSEHSILTSHSNMSDGQTTTTYQDYARKPPLSTTVTDSESAYVTGDGRSGTVGSAYFYSTGSSATTPVKYAQRPHAEVVAFRKSTDRKSSALPDERTSLSTFRRSDISDMDASTCSCTVTDNSSVLSDGASGSTVTPDRSAESGERPYRPTRPPPPVPRGAPSAEHLANYGANGHNGTSPSPLFKSPLRHPPATPQRADRPVSTAQFTPPAAYPNMAFAGSPSFDSLLLQNQTTPPISRNNPNLSSFGKAASDPKRRTNLPLETAM